MFMQMVFSKVHPARHNIVNSIKPGSNSIKTDKHAADRSNAVCKGIYVRCINCSYNNVAKGIRLLDKKAILVYTGKVFMQVRAYERYIPLGITKDYSRWYTIANTLLFNESKHLQSIKLLLLLCTELHLYSKY